MFALCAILTLTVLIIDVFVSLTLLVMEFIARVSEILFIVPFCFVFAFLFLFLFFKFNSYTMRGVRYPLGYYILVKSN